MKKKVKLIDGQQITIDKVVSTPISTTIYFHSDTALNDAIQFNIQSRSGELWRIDAAYPLNEGYTKWGVRLDSLYLTEKNYHLIPIATGGNDLGSKIKITKK